jgi:hypothetical protein
MKTIEEVRDRVASFRKGNPVTRPYPVVIFSNADNLLQWQFVASRPIQVGKPFESFGEKFLCLEIL